MDADPEDESLQSCNDLFLAEVEAEVPDESNGEGTDESSSEEDVYDSPASSRTGLSANPAVGERQPARSSRVGHVVARMGPSKLRSCRAGKVCVSPKTGFTPFAHRAYKTHTGYLAKCSSGPFCGNADRDATSGLLAARGRPKVRACRPGLLHATTLSAP